MVFLKLSIAKIILFVKNESYTLMSFINSCAKILLFTPTMIKILLKLMGYNW